MECKIEDKKRDADVEMFFNSVFIEFEVKQFVILWFGLYFQ